MHIRLLIFHGGGSHPFYGIDFRDINVGLDAAVTAIDEPWRTLAIKIAEELSKGQTVWANPVHAFRPSTETALVIPALDILGAGDRVAYAKLIEIIRNSTWGTHAYWVPSEVINPTIPTISSFHAWFESASARPMTGMPYVDSKTIMHLDPNNYFGDYPGFRNAVDRNIVNQNCSVSIIAAKRDRWRSVLPPGYDNNWAALRRVLGSHVEGEVGEVIEKRTNFAVIDRPHPETYLPTLRLLKATHFPMVLAGMVGPISGEDTIRGQIENEIIIPAVLFENEIELRFYIEILARESALMGAIRPNPRVIPANCYGALVPDPVFLEPAPIVKRTAMYTCAMATGTSQFFHSAQEFGDIQAAVPYDTQFCVRPLVTYGQLRDLLSPKAPHMDVWVHCGHGLPDAGLTFSDVPGGCAPLDLLKIFGLQTRSLPVVVFSACHSHELAKTFAENGAGVAIGFDGEAHSESCRRLTAAVVAAALHHRGDPREIYGAFEAHTPAFAAHLLPKRAIPRIFFRPA